MPALTPVQAERNRRQQEARRRAAQRLARMYPTMWRALQAEARADVDRERGPMPENS